VQRIRTPAEVAWRRVVAGMTAIVMLELGVRGRDLTTTDSTHDDTPTAVLLLGAVALCALLVFGWLLGTTQPRRRRRRDRTLQSAPEQVRYPWERLQVIRLSAVLAVPAVLVWGVLRLLPRAAAGGAGLRARSHRRPRRRRRLLARN